MNDHCGLAQRLTEAAEWLAEDLPERTVAPQFLEGDVPPDQFDQYCVEIMREAAAALIRATTLAQLEGMQMNGDAERSTAQNAKQQTRQRIVQRPAGTKESEFRVTCAAPN